MSFIVFTGPSLSPAEASAASDLDAVYLPPAAQGDLYQVARERPQAIGVIDGYFERVPSVWHKEILWALANGVHVYGAASMGALRAAELHPYGMVGVGAVFAAFRDGVLEDDDEVAVAHGPAAVGYRASSEAMVNVRATVGAALAGEIVTPATARALVGAMKARFYRERTWEGALEDALASGAPAGELAALRAWLPENAVDQKRADALAMLAHMERRSGEPSSSFVPSFRFERTDAWEQVALSAGQPAAHADEASQSGPGDAAVLDEARLEGEAAYRQVTQGAVGRALAEAVARRHGVAPNEAMLRNASQALRRRHGLADEAAVERWLDEMALDEEGLGELLGSEARVQWAQALYGPEWRAAAAQELRATGRWLPLAARAERKRQALAEAGVETPAPADVDCDGDELMARHFASRGVAQPDDLDGYVRALDLADADAFLALLTREEAYLRLRGD